MSATDNPSKRYVIRVNGHLDARWAAWFEPMTLTAEEDGTTALIGDVVDQAALHGILQKLRDAGVTLVAVIPTIDRKAEQ